MQNKVIFDFDETIVDINTFPRWVSYLILRSLRDFNFKLFFQVSFLVFQRKLRKKITHLDFKKSLILLNINEKINIDFSLKMKRFKNDYVVNCVKKHLSGGDFVVISSAAPFEYLKHTVEIIFGSESEILIIGSRVLNNEIIDNYKEAKVMSLYDSGCIERGEMLSCLYTDSWDDRFLGYISKEIFLIKPSQKDFYEYMHDDSLCSKVKVHRK